MYKTPELKELCTIYVGSDRYVAEVIEVIAKNRVVVRHMNSIRTDNNGGFSEQQEYRHESNLYGIVREVIKSRKGDRWKIVGSSTPVIFGHAEAYRSPHF